MDFWTAQKHFQKVIISETLDLKFILVSVSLTQHSWNLSTYWSKYLKIKTLANSELNLINIFCLGRRWYLIEPVTGNMNTQYTLCLLTYCIYFWLWMEVFVSEKTDQLSCIWWLYQLCCRVLKWNWNVICCITCLLVWKRQIFVDL